MDLRGVATIIAPSSNAVTLTELLAQQIDRSLHEVIGGVGFALVGRDQRELVVAFGGFATLGTEYGGSCLQRLYRQAPRLVVLPLSLQRVGQPVLRVGLTSRATSPVAAVSTASRCSRAASSSFLPWRWRRSG